MRMLDRHFEDILADLSDPFPQHGTCVDISNVAEWMYGLPQDEWQWSDFPCLAPPWELAWFEWSFPRNMVLRGSRLPMPDELAGARMGVLQLAAAVGPELSARVAEMDALSLWCACDSAQFQQVLMRDYRARCKLMQQLLQGVVVGWMLRRYLFMETSYGELRSVMFIGTYLDQAGQMPPGGQSLMCSLSPLISDATSELTQASTLFTPLNFALSLLHCKNVEAVDAPTPRHERRRAQRESRALVKYKTLAIEPMRRQVRAEREGGESEIQRALHICRGHFKTYSEDRPLFGKVAGTFWIPMHTRGSAAHGEVRKDYRVKAPKS